MAAEVTLAALTALMSKIGRANPDLMQDRNVALFIELVIEEARKLPAERAPIAPVDADQT